MRYTVLTYIFNGYEKVHEIREKDPDAEYILMTDDPGITSSTWTVICDREYENLSAFDKCYLVRFNPFKYANTDIVVRIDGSIEVRKPLTPLVDAFVDGEYDRCLMIHPDRNTMPEEYREWVRTRSYPQTQADKCLSLMKEMGYDFQYRGLYQGCFEIVRCNDINSELNSMTYYFLKILGEDDEHIERVDQTVTSFLANHFFADKLKVMPVSERIITDGQLMQWYYHNSDMPIKKGQKIAPVLFDKPVNPDNIFM